MLIALSIAVHVLGFGLGFARYMAADEACDLLSLAVGAVYAVLLLAAPHLIAASAGPAAGWLSLVLVVPAAIAAPSLRGRASSLVLQRGISAAAQPMGDRAGDGQGAPRSSGESEVGWGELESLPR